MAKKPTVIPTPTDPNALTTYAISDKAPPRIAGRRLEEGQTTIDLTENQARAELLAGHIVQAPASASTDA